jgi:putative chitinase
MWKWGGLVVAVVLLSAGFCAEDAAAQESGYLVHVVRSGETLNSIAAYYGVSTSALAQANGITNWNYIQMGQYLAIPYGTGGPVTSSGFSYVVQLGDTLYAIATRFGVSLTALAAANGITDWNYIQYGQVLNIPAEYGTGGPYTSYTPIYYTVRTGDTLSSIAARFGVSTATLAAANGITNWSYIQIAQVLVIP